MILSRNLKDKPKMIRAMSFISTRMTIMIMVTIMMAIMMVTAMVTSGSPIVLKRHLSMDWEN